MSSPHKFETGTERFGRNLREWRAKRGMSQDALADETGLSRVFISRIESGADTISLRHIDKIAAALKIDILDLFQH